MEVHTGRNLPTSCCEATVATTELKAPLPLTRESGFLKLLKTINLKKKTKDVNVLVMRHSLYYQRFNVDDI